jgi:hypothetical protein
MIGLPGEPARGQSVRAATTAQVIRYLKSVSPRTAPGSLSTVGSGGSTRRPILHPQWQWPLSVSSNPEPTWPWKVYNKTTGSTGQVQINGGDGFVAALNGKVANVNGSANDTKIGSPADYPKLAVTGNGVIYGYATPNAPGDLSSIATLDVYYADTLPDLDSGTPASFFPFLLATITDYAVDDSGNVKFTVNNATNYGYTSLIYCASAFQIY